MLKTLANGVSEEFIEAVSNAASELTERRHKFGPDDIEIVAYICQAAGGGTVTPLRGQQSMSLVDRPAPSAEDGPPCLKCGNLNTVVSPGVGPHHARIDCLKCKAWRWLPKPPIRGIEGQE